MLQNELMKKVQSEVERDTFVSLIITKIGIKHVYQSLIWMSGPVSGFLVQPLIGVASDSCRCKIGRRRPFIIFGTFIIGVGFGFMVAVDHIHSSMMKKIIFIFSLCLVNVSINIVQGPSRALLGDLIPPEQQVVANTIGACMLGLAAILTNCIGGFELSDKLKLSKFVHFDNQKLTIYFGLVLMFIGVIVSCVSSKEERFLGKSEKKNVFKEIFIALKETPKALRIVLVIYLFSWMSYFPFQLETTDFFGVDIFESKKPNDPEYEKGVSFGMLVLATSNVLVLLFGPFQELLVKKVGMKVIYGLSQVIEAVCLVCVFFVKNKYALLLILAPLGISCTLFNSIPFALLGIVVSQEKMGIYMGVMNIFAVVGQQISNFIFLSGVSYFSHQWRAPIIGGGSVFAIITSILCIWLEDPSKAEYKHLEG